VVELMRQGRTPEEACREAVERVFKKQQKRASEIQVGFIALNRAGQYGSYCLQKGFSYAVHNNSGNRLIEADSRIK
jgi:N4-(beta-N-acetylglucosaminyl)-L-asparaginase